MGVRTGLCCWCKDWFVGVRTVCCVVGVRTGLWV